MTFERVCICLDHTAVCNLHYYDLRATRCQITTANSLRLAINYINLTVIRKSEAETITAPPTPLKPSC